MIASRVAIDIGVKGGDIQTILVESEQEVQLLANCIYIEWLDTHNGTAPVRCNTPSQRAGGFGNAGVKWFMISSGSQTTRRLFMSESIYIHDDEHGVKRAGRTRVMLDSVIAAFHQRAFRGNDSAAVSRADVGRSLRNDYLLPGQQGGGGPVPAASRRGLETGT